MKYLVLISLLTITLAEPIQAQEELKNGNELIQKMYQKYHNKWYKNLTFKQKTIFYKDNKVSKEELWHEAIQMPEGIIVKFGDINGGNGVIFKNDTMKVINNGIKTFQKRKVHDLLVLGFSVYFDKPETTVSKLEEAGFDFNYIKTDKIDGKSYFVVGDPTKKQFWVEAENFLFTKIETHNTDGSIITTEFKDYKKLNKGWIATTVVFSKDGELEMREEYLDIKTPKKLPKDLLEYTSFTEMKW